MKNTPIIDLSGPEGNAFVLLGYASRWGRKLGKDTASIHEEMTSGDYTNLVRVFIREFDEVCHLVIPGELADKLTIHDEVSQLRADLAEERKRVSVLLTSAKDLVSLVSVLHGRGPDCTLPGRITTPLGVKVEINAIMLEAQAAIAEAEGK